MRAQNCSIEAGSSAGLFGELAFILRITVQCVGRFIKLKCENYS